MWNNPGAKKGPADEVVTVDEQNGGEIKMEMVSVNKDAAEMKKELSCPSCGTDTAT